MLDKLPSTNVPSGEHRPGPPGALGEGVVLVEGLPTPSLPLRALLGQEGVSAPSPLSTLARVLPSEISGLLV